MSRQRILLLLILLGLCQPLSAQSVTSLQSAWLQAPGSFKFRIDSDGSLLLVHGVHTGQNRLVAVPTAGGVERIVYTHNNPGTRILDFALSGDGKTAAFSLRGGTMFGQQTVFGLSVATGKVTTIATLATDRDPWDIRLSHDGRWALFRASRWVQIGSGWTWRDHIFTARTDGLVLHQVTQTPIHFAALRPPALSDDGTTVAWFNDQYQPMCADRDGKNRSVLPLPPGKPVLSYPQIFPDETGRRIFYSCWDNLYSVLRGATRCNTVYSLPGALFEVSSDGDRIRAVLNPWGRGSSLMPLSRTRLEKMFEFSYIPQEAVAWSRDGNVCVWIDDGRLMGHRAMVWRHSIRFGSNHPVPPGGVLNIDLEAAGAGGHAYYMAASLATSPPIPIQIKPGKRHEVPLAFDPLFLASWNLPSIFRNFVGLLDSGGRARAAIAVPGNARLKGVSFFVAYVTIDARPNVTHVSRAQRIRIR